MTMAVAAVVAAAAALEVVAVARELLTTWMLDFTAFVDKSEVDNDGSWQRHSCWQSTDIFYLLHSRYHTLRKAFLAVYSTFCISPDIMHCPQRIKTGNEKAHIQVSWMNKAEKRRLMNFAAFYFKT